MEETISLQDLFKTLKKRLALILTCMILAVTIAGVVSYLLMTPVYQAATQILVNQSPQQDQDQFTSQEIQTNLQLINTYNVIIKSPAILEKVIERLSLDMTPSQLTQKIEVNSAENSQVLNVTVEDPEPYRAADIANTTAEVFEQEIPQLMNVDNVNILSPAVLGESPQPVKPDPMLNMAIGAVIGLMLGVGMAFLLEYLDTSIKNERDVEEILEMPILGLISPIPESDVNLDNVVKNRRKRR